MRKLAFVALVSASWLLPKPASSAQPWELVFNGSSGLRFVISDLSGTPYVSSFWMPGASDLPLSIVPIAVGWNRTLPETHANEFGALSLLSSVTLSPTGGAIRIGPSDLYEAGLDSHLDVTLNYRLSTPEPIGATFADNAVSGSYTYDYFWDDLSSHPDFSLDSGQGGGTLSSLTTASVPEPATWAMLIGGLYAVGAALRMRRSAVAVSR
jgi:hypothetical protein